MLCDTAPLFCLVRIFLKQKCLQNIVKNLSLRRSPTHVDRRSCICMYYGVCELADRLDQRIVRSENRTQRVVFVERYQMHLIHTYTVKRLQNSDVDNSGAELIFVGIGKFHTPRMFSSAPLLSRSKSGFPRLGQCNSSCWQARITALSLVIGQDTPWKEFSGIFLWRRRAVFTP